MSSKILLRRGTAAQWSSANPILGIGELGIETDTLKIKIGNGTSAWTQLTSYANVTPSQLTSEINNLINAAPATLDTLNELAAAINNDASFSTTVNNLLTGKVSKSGGDTITASTSSTVGLIIKAAASQTANIVEFQLASSAQPYFFMTPAGNGIFYTALSVNQSNSGSVGANNGIGAFEVKGTSFMRPISATGTVLIVRGAASQTAKLQEWQNSAGTVVASTSVEGNGYFQANLNAASIGAGNNIGGASLTASPWGASTIVSIIRGYTSQTADLTQWQNSSGVVLAKIDSSGAIYLINPNSSANAGAITSPSINFQGSIWNNAYGSQTIKGAINVTEYLGNTNPTISKMAFLLATDNGTPAEVASFTNTGAFSNIGGLDAYGSNVIFRLRNTTDATTLAHAPSPKLELMGRAWNSSQGSAPTRAYLQVNANNINSDPFINRLGFFVATGNNAGGWTYGADATEYMSILGNGTVGINSTTPLATLDVRPTSASNKGILIRGTSLYAANFIDFQNNSGNTIARVAESGQAMFVNYWDANTQGESQGARIALTATSAASPVAIFKAAGSQTANLQEWQNSAGTVLAKVAADGQLSVGNGTSNYLSTYDAYGNITSRTAGTNYSANISVLTGATSYIGMVIRGQASQTANLQEWQNSSGNVRASISATGGLSLNYANGIKLYNTANTDYASLWMDNGSAGTNLYVKTNYPVLMGNVGVDTGASLTVATQGVSQVGQVIRGIASQTANLQEWQNSSGTVLGRVDNYGALYLSETVQIGPGTTDQRIAGGGLSIIHRGGTSSVTFGIKAIASQTGDLTQWQNSAGGNVLRVTAGGGLLSSNQLTGISESGELATGFTYVKLGTASTFAVAASIQFGALVNIGSGGNAAFVPLAIRGSASQTANLQEWQDSAGTVLNSITSDGTFKFKNSVWHKSMTDGQDRFYYEPYSSSYYKSANAHYFRNSTDTTFLTINNVGNVLVNGFTASTVGLTVKAAASQTANLQEWQDSSGAVIAKLDPAGGFTAGTPATTNIKLDATAAGAKLHFGTPATFNNYATLGAYSSMFNIEANARSILATVTNSTTTTTLIVKAIASQTANLQEWQNSAGTVLANVTSGGTLRVPLITDVAITGAYINMTSTTVTVQTRSASNVGFRVDGVASQTANLQEWRDSAGTVLARISSGGNLLANDISVGSSSAYGVGSFGSGSNSIQQLLVTNGAAGRIGLIVKGAASQTANLQEWQNSDAVAVAQISATGTISTKPVGFSGNLNTPIISVTDRGSTWSPGNFSFRSDSNGIPRFSFTGPNAANEALTINGNFVGVQTPSPASVFQVTSSGTSHIVSIVKGAASQTADLQQWQNSSGTVMVKIAADGSQTWYNASNGATIAEINIYGEIFAQGNMYVRSAGNYGASLNILTPATTHIGAVIRGTSGQTANLQEWQNSAGTALSYIKPDGSLFVAGNSNTVLVSATASSGVHRIISNGNDLNISPYYDGIFGPAVSSGSWRPANDATSDLGTSGQRWKDLYATSAVFVNNSTSKTGLIVKSISSQTANLQEWQNVGGTVLAKITASGALDVTAITVNGAAITSTPTTSDVELMNIMGAY